MRPVYNGVNARDSLHWTRTVPEPGDAFGVTAMPIMLSETAAKEIRDIIKQQDLPGEKTRLRVGVKGGGCSGFSYMLDLTEEEPTEADEQMESHGIKILVDN